MPHYNQMFSVFGWTQDINTIRMYELLKFALIAFLYHNIFNKFFHFISSIFWCRTPLHEECPQHHGHKGNPTRTCGAIGERAQVILGWMKALDVGNASQPQRIRGTRVRPWVASSLWHLYSRMLKETPQSEVWARRYGNLSGAMLKNNALEHQWPRNGAQDCQGLNNRYFLNVCLNETSEGSIDIWIEWLLDSIKDHGKKLWWSKVVGGF